MPKKLFDELDNLITEQRNPRSMNVDSMNTEEILKLINEEDSIVPAAVAREIPHITKAVEIVVNSFKKGGRLIYAGAGTSGRLGFLDAAECPPTFGTDPDMVIGLIAGGKDALYLAREGSEDRVDEGRKVIAELGITKKDVVCGLAASRRTPFAVAAIQTAREYGAKTIFITTNPRSDFNLEVDVAICPDVGQEVITGSTRMKSGTAQKLILNMITTTAMIRIGKVYENLMVDLKLNSEKLKERGKKIVITVTGVSYDDAERVLEEAKGDVKSAIVMLLAGVDLDEARNRLNKSDGFIRGAIRG